MRRYSDPRSPSRPLRECLLRAFAAAEALHGFLDLALLVFLPQLVTLVDLCLALGQAELDLGVAAQEVELERDERVAAFPELDRELARFLAVLFRS